MDAQEPRASLATSREQAWLGSRLLRRQVVNTSTLEPLGRIADVALDPERCRVAALSIQLTPAEGGSTSAVRRALGRRRTVGAVGIDHVVALNGDVVMVDSEPVRPASLRYEGQMVDLRDICELTILTLHGTCLGSLADVLLDSEGRDIIGYVVSPTKQGEECLMPLADLLSAPPMPSSTEQVKDAAAASDAAPLSGSPTAGPRIIPASPRVRIGESLVLVIDEAEPLRLEPVTVTSRAQEGEARVPRPVRQSGFYSWRRTQQSGRS